MSGRRVLFLLSLLLVSLYEPIHAWLHAHLQLLAGVVIGSVAQLLVTGGVARWLRDRWLWMRWFSWQ
jgi:putative effector of murein hydrolase